MEKPRQKLRAALEACPVYPILDVSTLEIHSMDLWLTTIAQAGARIVQLRLKDSTEAYMKHIGGMFVEKCKMLNIISIINDKTDIALALGADGVHLGIQDELITDARLKTYKHATSGTPFIIGGSSRTVEGAKTLESIGATYLGCGACFQTKTKSDAIYIGLERLTEVAANVTIPVVGIGGITWENCIDVLKAGASGFAAITLFHTDLASIALNISLVKKRNR